MGALSSYMIFSAIDTMWVGRLGRHAVAGAAVGGAVMFLCFMASRLVSIGSMSLIARSHGSKDEHTVRRVAAESHILLFALGVVELLLLARILPHLIAFLDLDPTTAAAATIYTSIVIIAPPFWYVTEAGFAYFNATGRTRVPFLCATMACVLNIVLDPILIFGLGPIPALGLAGAAWATVLAALLEALLVISIQAHARGFARPRTSLEPYKSLLSIGIPAGIKDLGIPLVDLCMVTILATFGNAAVAAFGIAGRLVGLMIIYVQGLAVAVASLAGQELGRGRPQNARLVLVRAIVLGLTFHILTCIPIILIPDRILRFFIDDALVLAVGIPLLRYFSFAILFTVVSSNIGALFQASGRTRVILAASILSSWFFQIPASIIAARLEAPLQTIWTIVVISRGIELIVLIGGWTGHSTTNVTAAAKPSGQAATSL